MIDEKKLIEELKESGFIIDDDFGNELVDFIDAQPKTGEWIPVSERLPDDSQSVLTCKNGICEIQTYEKRRNGWLCNGWFWSMATVTHWMPLPEPWEGEK